MMSEEITRLEQEMAVLREKLVTARKAIGPESVDNYEFPAAEGGAVTLSELFGDKQDLLVIHNMGKACRYCTLWADGLNGVVSHLANRAGLALFSPDDPQTQRAFAESRGWRFRVVSYGDTDFAAKMGFNNQPDRYMPGASAFLKRADGSIVRTGRAYFGPGDDFCAVWHLFDLFADGAAGWEPQYAY